MPYYYEIKWMPEDMRERTLSGLERLRDQLDAEMPSKTRTETLILGTWNIRNFDDNRFVNGKRTKEDLFYIAEITSRFDIIAVQEICEDLGPIDELMRILGRDYDYIVTDKTEGRSGNDERLGFIFDTAKVKFMGVAGELVLPESMEIIHDEKKRQFSRTPYMCEFQSGWFKFKFSTVHIYFGDNTGPKFERRIKEIKTVAEFLASRAEDDDSNHVLVGDFNIKKVGSRGFNALEDSGFTVFQNDEGSNKDQTKFYDQISFMSKRNRVQIRSGPNSKGVLQFFDSIFKKEDFLVYRGVLLEAMEEKIANFRGKIQDTKKKLGRAQTSSSKEKHRERIQNLEDDIADVERKMADDSELEKYYLKEWRTFHASDHLPLWVELRIDFSEEYLTRLATL